MKHSLRTFALAAVFVLQCLFATATHAIGVGGGGMYQ